MVCYLCGFCNRVDTRICVRCDRSLLEESGRSLFPRGLGFVATLMAALALLVAAGSALNSDTGDQWHGGNTSLQGSQTTAGVSPGF